MKKLSSLSSPQDTQSSRTKRVVIDTETDDLNPTVLHTFVTTDIDSKEVIWWTKELHPEWEIPGATNRTFEEFPRFAREVKLWVGHNIVCFDWWVVLRKFFPEVVIRLDEIVDTIILSRLYNFKREGGHSLRAWGIFFGDNKIDFHDFSTLTRDMVVYCIQDVALTLRLFRYLLKEGKDFSRESSRLEHATARCCQRMKENGFTLDYKQALELLSEIGGKKDALQISLSKDKPKVPSENRTVKYKVKKDGELSSLTWKPLEGNTRKEDIAGDYSLVTWTEFNPGSHAQIAYQLKLLGWVPTKFTEAGNASTDEDTLLEAAEKFPEARDIAKFLTLGKRFSQIASWVKFYNPKTGRVHGTTYHIGAKTHRASHAEPNFAQVTSVPHDPKTGAVLKGEEGLYGFECRDVWTVPKGYKLVGVDASAIQLVILADAMGNKEFADAVAFGDKKKGTDVHTKNRNVLRESVCELTLRNDVDYLDRDKAKTFIYAFLLGAGKAKVDEILSTTNIGNKVKDKFVDRTPGLRELQERLKEEIFHTGKIKAIDGRFFPCNDPHFALSYVLQGTEQVIMKMVMVKVQDWIDKENIDAKILAWVHDELQIEVRDINSLPELVSKKVVEIIEEVGKELKLKCFLTGEGKIGNTWAECH